MEPAPGTRDVPVWASIVLSLDRRVFPQSVGEDALRVRSGSSRPYLAVTYDPVTATLRATPMYAMLSNVSYMVTLTGLFDLDGRSLPEPFVATFATGEQLARPVRMDDAPFQDALALLAERCGEDACHGGPAPLMGLDLASGAGIEATAIGVPVRTARAGSAGRQAPRGALTLSGLPRIDRVGNRGEPGSSYLLYKVLGDPHVWGERMPPPDRAALSYAETALLRDWIWAGARTRP